MDCRPWSRESKKKWKDLTIDRLKASKTIWPIPQIEQVFLPDFKIKSQINEYSFKSLELISNGAFGKVYKVEKLNSSGDLYAMKILEKSSVVCENGIQQVKNEVQIQSLCGHHPFIVNCPFFWQNRNQLFIVSEYVGGGELLKLIQKYGPLPEELCRLYFAELVVIIVKETRRFCLLPIDSFRKPASNLLLYDIVLGDARRTDFGWISVRSLTKQSIVSPV